MFDPRRFVASVFAGLGLLFASSPVRGGELEEKLWEAARKNDAVEISRLLDAGAEIDAVFRDGGTALVFAAQRGHAEAVRVLLARGANPNAGSILTRVSALHFATRFPEVVKLLVDHGADVNARDLQGLDSTPLTWTVVFNCMPCAEHILASGRASSETLTEAFAMSKRGKAPTGFDKLFAAALEKNPHIPAWPQFRGRGASGLADGQRLPVTWDVPAGKNVLWKTPIPGLAHSSPVVWADQVFVVTAVSSQAETDFVRGGSPLSMAADRSRHTWKLLALDRKTGQTTWERTLKESEPTTGRHPKNSYASQTPATDGQRVVVFLGSEGLYSYSLGGDLLWKKDLGKIDSGMFFDPQYSWGTASSPILWRDLVIVQADQQFGSFLAAFDVATGDLRWKTERDELPSYGTPTIYEGPAGVELITNGINAMRGYDPETGKELWQVKTGNSMVSGSTPITSPDLVVVSNGYRPMQPLIAVRPGSRGDLTPPDGQDTSTGVVWSKKSGGSYYVTPLLYGDMLYVLAHNAVLTVYYAPTGEQAYKMRVGEGANGFSASPVGSDGRIFLASEDGDVYVVRAGNEFQVISVNRVGELMMATPALVDGTIILRTRSHLIALKEGASLPSADRATPPPAAPAATP